MALFFTSTGLTEEQYKKARYRMVERQIAGREVQDKRVLEAMRKVPRHLFVPEQFRREAYGDNPLPLGFGQTISQPYIVASMTELLHPDEKKRVLEIGTGSGYQTAILAELFEHVDTVEYFPALSAGAKRILEDLGYKNITYHVGDGLKVPSITRTFDAILASAAPRRLPDELAFRLAEGGRMVLPVGEMVQYLYLVICREDRCLEIRKLYQVKFVPFQS